MASNTYLVFEGSIESVDTTPRDVSEFDGLRVIRSDRPLGEIAAMCFPPGPIDSTRTVHVIPITGTEPRHVFKLELARAPIIATEIEGYAPGSITQVDTAGNSA